MRIRSILVSIILITPAAVAMADCPVNFVYRDAKGNVHDFHFDGKAWQKLQLNNGGMTAAPAASGDPSAFALGAPSFFSFASPRWILPADHRDFSYVGANGDLHHIFHQGGKWAHDLLNNAGLTSAPPSAGQVAATAFNLRQLTYTFRDPDGNLQHIASFEENWHGYRLNNGGATAAPLAAGDPAGTVGQGGQLDWVYRNQDGNLQHLSGLQGKWSAERVNEGAHVTMALPVGGLKFY